MQYFLGLKIKIEYDSGSEIRLRATEGWTPVIIFPFLDKTEEEELPSWCSRNESD